MNLKTCKCGRSYDEAAWRKLPFRGFMDDLDVNPEDGTRLELRDCLCGSTIAIERPPAPERPAFVFVGRLKDLVRSLARRIRPDAPTESGARDVAPRGP